MVPLLAEAVAAIGIDAGAENTCPAVGVVILTVGLVVTMILMEVVDDNPLLSMALAPKL